MTRFRTFFLGLAATFFFPWLILIVLPHAEMRALQPVAVDPEDATKGEYPPPVPNIAKQGEKIYAREGCAQCHTQVVRPTYLGIDSYKKGWGREQENLGAPVLTRSTQPLDYYGESYAYLGVERSGPDLSNYGYRAPDAATLHAHLYSPKDFAWWSTMPSYRNFYEVRKIQGQPSEDALAVSGKHAPADGHEIVPTADARALVGYLMTLKKDADLPGAAAKDGAAVPVAPAPVTPPAS
jgi:cytochrome c oxidase cbb3-type subunit 2